MTTAAIMSVTSPDQIQAALEMATRVLKPASQINNATHLVVFGTSLSHSRVQTDSVAASRSLNKLVQKATDAIPGMKLDDFHLIVGPGDLQLVQFIPNAAIGQLCEVTSVFDEIQDVVNCLIRPVAPGLDDVDALPSLWADHQHNLNHLQYFHDLWAETVADDAKKGEDKVNVMARIPNPKPALLLAMFAKAASIATNVCQLSLSLMTSTVAATQGSKGLGLMGMFGDDAINAQEFLAQYLVGDEAPWAVNRRGEYASEAAEKVLIRLFAHAKQVGKLALNAKLVDVVPSKTGVKDGFLVIDCSNNGKCARLIAGRVPKSVRAVDRQLEMDFEYSDDWISSVNNKMFTAIESLLEPMDAEEIGQFAVFTALASPHLHVPGELMDEDLDNLILKSSDARDLVTTTSIGLVAHVFNELNIHNDRIERVASGAHVLVQRGSSVSCTFATFCPTTANSLNTNEFNPASLSELDVVGIQTDLNSIANSIDRPYRPLGSLVGILGSEVEFNGAKRRLAFWKRRNEARDGIVTFLPAEYVNVAFADYATSSRALLRSQTKRGNDVRPPIVPMFASDSIFSMSTASSLKDSNGLAFSVPAPERAGFLGQDEQELYAGYARAASEKPDANTELPSSLGGSFLSFYVRESVNDPLCGIKVAWSRTNARSGELFTLVSENAEFERVVF